MKLYLTAGACSLADHIAMHEAGLAFDRIRVDMEKKRTEVGDDYVFSPGISWSGSSLNFWGSAVHCLQMNS